MRIPAPIHDELCNWSRWCWSGSWPHPLPATHCGSLEAQYRAPPEWDTLDVRREYHIRPNERHAKIVQAIYDDLPEQERLVLKAEYPGRETSGRNESKTTAAARLNLPIWKYDDLLMNAAGKVGRAFEGVTA